MTQNFHPTHWTLVLRAGVTTPAAKAALSDLCAAYYAPVVAFLRREGRSDDEARDLAHSFFAQILEKGLGAPSGERGRFRSYLLGALKHFLTNFRVAENRAKRGGKAEHIPLVTGTDTQPGIPLPAALEPAPELVFDQEWAFTLISRSLAALELENAGNAAAFEILRPWLDGQAKESHAETAAKLGISEGAVKVAIFRLRSRFREILRSEVAATVPDASEVSGELQHLVNIACR